MHAPAQTASGSFDLQSQTTRKFYTDSRTSQTGAITDLAPRPLDATTKLSRHCYRATRVSPEHHCTIPSSVIQNCPHACNLSTNTLHLHTKSRSVLWALKEPPMGTAPVQPPAPQAKRRFTKAINIMLQL